MKTPNQELLELQRHLPIKDKSVDHPDSNTADAGTPT